MGRHGQLCLRQPPMLIQKMSTSGYFSTLVSPFAVGRHGIRVPYLVPGTAAGAGFRLLCVVKLPEGVDLGGSRISFKHARSRHRNGVVPSALSQLSRSMRRERIVSRREWDITKSNYQIQQEYQFTMSGQVKSSAGVELREANG